MSRERQENLKRLDGAAVNVLVIGGGINGAVAAAALAGQGTNVALVEAADFASGVSSESSNLAWGGIKYLESRELGLVRKLCRSRNRLMDAYPANVREIRFFTSIRRGFRLWPVFVWLGAVLYWLMGNGRLRFPRYLSRRRIAEEAPEVAAQDVVGGLEYSDCYLVENDARFVFGFVRQAMDAGALAANYLGVEALTWADVPGEWQVRLRDKVSGQPLNLSARAVVNATGPGADAINRQVAVQTDYHHVLSKGIHLIVDRLSPVERVLTFFASDGRLFFVIPMGNRTCIGTTDTPVENASVTVSDDDRDFVLANANALLKLDKPLTRDDVIAERVGVRPLAVAGESTERDWVQLSRKHEIEVDEQRRFLSIFGGKLTDCLNVGEEVVSLLNRLGIAVPDSGKVWYGQPPLARRAAFLAAASSIALDERTPAGSDVPLTQLLWRRYGEDAFQILEAVRDDPEGFTPLFPGVALIRAELEVLLSREMVVEPEDLLRRRTMAALMMPQDQLEASLGYQTVLSRISSTRSS